MSFSVSYVITGRDELSKVLAKVTANLEKLDAAAQKLNRTMAILGSAKGGFMKGANALGAMAAAINSMDVGKMRQVNEQFAKMQRNASRATGGGGGGRRGGATQAGGGTSNLPAVLARASRVYEGEYIPRGATGGGGGRRGRTFAGDYSEVFARLPAPPMSSSAAARALGTGSRAQSGFVGPAMPAQVMLARGLQRLGQQAMVAASSVGQLGAAARRSTPSLGYIAGELFAGATLAAPAVLPIMQYAGMESMEKTFELKTGSAATAASMMKELKDFASTAPFAFEQISNASQKLSMAGIEGEKLTGVMTDLGNISAVSGANIDEIAWAYSRIHRMGIATNEELELMTDRNVDILGYIQRYLKDVKGVEVSYMAIRKAAENQALAAALVEESTAYAGQIHMKAMEERSKTLSGQWELIKSNTSVFAADLGKAESDALGLKTHLAEINEYIKTHRLKTAEELSIWEKIGIAVGKVAIGATVVAVIVGTFAALGKFVFGKLLLVVEWIVVAFARMAGWAMMIGRVLLGWGTSLTVILADVLVWLAGIPAAVITAVVAATVSAFYLLYAYASEWWEQNSLWAEGTWNDFVRYAQVAMEKVSGYWEALKLFASGDFEEGLAKAQATWNMKWTPDLSETRGVFDVNLNMTYPDGSMQSIVATPGGSANVLMDLNRGNTDLSSRGWPDGR